jgi:hypothetical protein
MKEINEFLKTCYCRTEGRDHFRDLGNEEIILKWTLQELGVLMWTQFIWLRMRTSSGVVWNVQDP